MNNSQPAPAVRSQRLGRFILILFATPFAAIGVTAIGVGLYRLADGRVTEAAGTLFLGLVFAGIGFGLIAAGRSGQKEEQKKQQLQSAHPDAPWMWREDWAAGHISSSARTSTAAAWGFAIFWNFMSTPLLFVLPGKWTQSRAALIFLIFPVVGVFLLVRAIRLSMELRKFGGSDFVMSSIPGVVGGKLSGSIYAAFDPRSPRSVTLKLTCLHRVASGSGDDRSVLENILWRDERTLEVGEAEAGPSGSRIPVLFRIPSDATETSISNMDNAILWKLDVHADMPGLDYAAQFDVPIFRTKDSSLSEDQAQTVEPPQNSRIRVQPTAGGTEFIFPAARNPGVAASVTLLFLIWSAGTWFFASFLGPSVIVSIYIAFFLIGDIVLLLAVIMMWFVSDRVAIEAGRVTIRRGFLGITWSRRIACADVSDLKLNVGLQTGGGSGTPYYDIQLICRDGRKRTAGRQIRNKREAVWLMNQIKQAIRA